MRTLLNLLFVLIMASFLMGQIDSTATETVGETAPTEFVVEEADTNAIDMNDIVTADTLATETAMTADSLEMVSDTVAVDSLLEDTADMIDAAVDTLLAFELKPVRIVGLMYDGPLYFWSNDNLANIGFTDKPYMTIEDPSLIAVRANACIDVVCHLLATEISDADFVVVSADDTSMVQVYEVGTRANIVEASGQEALALFETFLMEHGYEGLFEAAPPVVAAPEPDNTLALAQAQRRAQAELTRERHFRSMDELFSNPGNLAREYESHTTWNLLPDFAMNIHNSLLTPGWYKEWWTVGGVWDAGMKNDYLSTIQDKDLALSFIPDFQTIFGFRIGRFGFNISGKSYINMVLPANLLGLPMQDILIDEPIRNGGLDMELIPFASKTSISYAHPLETTFGDLSLGVNLNIYEAFGYMRLQSEDFTILMTTDSVHVTASGESWATIAGAEGHLDDPNIDNLETSETLSDITPGLDLGMVLDLRERLNQEVEVHLTLSNLGAKYRWSNLQHESWTFKQSTPGLVAELDSIEQYQVSESVLISPDEELDVEIPTVLNISAFYQPIPNVLLGAGFQQAFTDEARLGYSPDLGIILQANYYPVQWFDISYSMQPRFGDPSHTFGTGLHFGFLDAGAFVTLVNGLNSDAKGMGFGFQSSLHF